MNLKYDFHGLRKEEAEHKAESLLFRARGERSQFPYEFITGTGSLQDHLKGWCKKNGLEHQVSSWNPGVLKVTLE